MCLIYWPRPRSGQAMAEAMCEICMYMSISLHVGTTCISYMYISYV